VDREVHRGATARNQAWWGGRSHRRAALAAAVLLALHPAQQKASLDDGDFLAVLRLTGPRVQAAAAQPAYLVRLVQRQQHFLHLQLGLSPRAMASLRLGARRLRRLVSSFLAGGAKEPLLHESQLLLELRQLQLQVGLGVLALEAGHFRDKGLEALVQPGILRLQQAGHLLRRLQVAQLLDAHHAYLLGATKPGLPQAFSHPPPEATASTARPARSPPGRATAH